MNTYLLELYRNMFTSLKRGRYRGIVSNAKPIFLLSLLEAVPFIKNEFYFDNSIITQFYQENKPLFEGKPHTPLIAPFFHLDSEPFYYLVWRDSVKPPLKSTTPSAKFLRENLLYAKLDDELWELLQEEDNREYLKQAIINQYLKN